MARLAFPHPESLSPLVADLYADHYVAPAAASSPSERPGPVLAETFICVEPSWVLTSRAVPLWLVFPTEPSLAALDRYLAGHPARDLVVTHFAHGVASAGYAAPQRWRAVAGTHDREVTFAGVRERQCPADFPTLARYSPALDRLRRRGEWPARLDLATVEGAVRAAGPGADVTWEVLCPART